MKTEGVINYTGNKSKLIEPLNDLFKLSNAERLVDVCAGGLSVTLHSNFDNVLSNDINPVLIEIYKYLDRVGFINATQSIKAQIVQYGLGKEKEKTSAYMKYRDVTNQMIHSQGYDEFVLLRILVLHYHSFSNIIRFNSDGEFNAPFGQRTYNKSSERKLHDFFDMMREKEVEFSNVSFEELAIGDDDLVYVDPPYLITEAVYNAGWNAESDKKLMEWLDNINEDGVDFVMSNVFHHRGKSNDALIEWAKKYNVHTKNHRYVFNSYQAKDQDQETVEVMITNMC